MPTFTSGPPPLQTSLLEEVSIERGWSLIERFSDLVRESGSEDEREAARYICGELEDIGIPYELHEPDLYLSLPREASVSAETLSEPLHGKPPAFSTSTGAGGLQAPLIHVPAGDGSSGDLFADRYGSTLPDVEGKIVVTEGYGLPTSVRRLERAGAAGQIHINPGENIHWGICTPLWGAPTDSTWEAKPGTPIVSLSRPDGDRLLEAIDGGLESAILQTRLEEGWFRCLLPVAKLQGRSDRFVLVHGHYDSWDVGIGDNAVGDATLLELARLFHGHRDELRRSMRIAWWPGHSTGRYAGSTWYADRFALDLRKRCVATVNIDSPGCWRATAYEDVAWMAEAADHCKESIRDVTGQDAEGGRPPRAGDYSFGQIGVTSFFMLLSSIPAGERERLGFYPVGGCGGNIAWHTEDDRMEVADRDNLERDLRVYVAALSRLVQAEILPFDYRSTLDEIEGALHTYRRDAERAREQRGLKIPAIDLGFERVAHECAVLRDTLDWLYGALDSGSFPESPAEINDLLMELARRLVPLSYAEGERFEHDPALPRPPLPKLAVASRLAEVNPERRPFLETELRRRANQVANQLYEAHREVSRLRPSSSSP